MGFNSVTSTCTFKPGAHFSKVQKRFQTRKAVAEISDLKIAELCLSSLHTRSFRCLHLSVFTVQIQIN